MLDIDTLNALHDLMANTLYHAEVARLPKLTRAEEAELVRRARHGDTEARAGLIVSCLAYVLYFAIRLFTTRQPAHDEALDLAQAANLEMVAVLDKALDKANPASYLRAVARKALVIHLIYHTDLIRKPELPLAELAAKQIPTVESLDTPAFRSSSTLKIDLIEMAPPPDEEHEGRFAPLYEALARLTPRQRNSIAKRYGIGEIDESIPVYNPTEAHKALRRALAPYVSMMVSQEHEE